MAWTVARVELNGVRMTVGPHSMMFGERLLWLGQSLEWIEFGVAEDEAARVSSARTPSLSVRFVRESTMMFVERL